MIASDKAVQFMKDNYDGMANKSDYEILELAKETFPDYEYEETNPYSPQLQDTAITSDVESYGESDDSPSAFNDMLSGLNFNEVFAEQGIESLGVSPEFFKKSFNESAAGLLYAAKNGKFKYDVGDYDPSVWASIGSFATGLLNPVDAALFIGSGGVGAKAGQAIGGKLLASDFAKKGFASGIANKVKNDVGSRALYNSIVESGFGLAAYSGAAGMLGETSKQSVEITSPEMAKKHFGQEAKERTEFDEWGIFKTGAAHAAEGLALGSVTGPTGHVIGKTWGKAIDKATKNGSKRKAAIYQKLNIPTQVAAEGVEFTVLPYAIHGGPENMEQFQHDLIHNMGVIGTLKGTTSLFKQGREDLQQLGKAGIQIVEEKTGKKFKEIVKESAQNEREGQVAQWAIDELNRLEKGFEVKEGQKPGTETSKISPIEQFKEANQLVQIVIDKLEGAKDYTPKEKLRLAQEGVTGLMALSQFYRELGKDKSFAEKMTGRRYSDEEFAALQKGWERKLKNIEDARNELNNPKKFKSQEEAPTPTTVETPTGRQVEVKNVEKMGNQELYDYGREILGLDSKEFGKRYGENASELSYNKLKKDIVKKVGTVEEPFIDTPSTPEYKAGNVPLVHKQNVVEPTQLLNMGPKELGKYFGISAKRAKGIKAAMEAVEKSFEGYNVPVGGNRNNIDMSKGFLNYISQKVLQTEKGGPAGKAQTPKELKKSVERMKNLSEFAQFLSDRDKNFYNMDKQDIDAFLLNKKGVYANDVNFVINNIKDFNPNVRGIEPGKVVSLVSDVVEPKKGAQKEYINTKEKKIVYVSSKTGNSVEVPITDSLLNRINALIERNIKEKKPSGFKDIDGIPNDFIFFTETNKPVTLDMLNQILKSPTISGAIGRKISQKALRKSFATWAKSKGKSQKLQDMIDQVGLGHGTGEQVKKKYFKWTDANFKEYRKMQKEFMGEILGKKKLPKEKGKDHLTTWELREIFKAVDEHSQFLKIGKSEKTFEYINKETVKDIFQYMLETNARGIEALPNKDYLNLIEWNNYKQKNLTKKVEKQSLKFQLENLGVPELEPALRKLVQRQLELNPGLNVVFEKNKKGEYAGYFDAVNQGVINLVVGKANAQTFFHENSHRFEAFIRDAGNKEMIKLWDRGEGMFKKDAAKHFGVSENKLSKKQLNEYFTDRVADYGTGMSKGVRNKISNWGKLMMSKIKQFLFGKSNLNKNDIKRLLGEKVYKGFSTENVVFRNNQGRKFQELEINDPKKFSKYLTDELDLMLGKNLKLPLVNGKVKVDAKTRNAFIRTIAQSTGFIENPKQFKLNKDAKVSDLASFAEALSSADIQAIKKKRDIIDWVKEYGNLNKARLNAGITDATQSTFLKSLYVKSGNIHDASLNQLKQYSAFVKEVGVKTTHENWLQAAVKEGAVDKETLQIISRMGEIKAMALPVQVVLDKIGFKDLSNKLFSHSSAELSYIGKLSQAEGNIAAIMITGDNKIKSNQLSARQFRKGGAQFDKIKDYLPAVLDKQRMLERIKLDANKESGFKLSNIEKGLINEIWIKKGDKYSINENTKAGKIALEIKKMNKFFKEEFETVMKKILNPAQYEDYIKNNSPKWIEDGVYVTRQLTKEFKDFYNPKSETIRKMIEQDASEIAFQMAKDKLKNSKKKNVTEKDILELASEFEPAAKEMAKAQMNDRMKFSDGKFQSSFLMKRHSKLPEFFTAEDGRRIKVYETSYDGTVKKYALGMSKMLANTEFFPEYVRLKGMRIPGIKGKLQELREASPQWAEFVTGAIESQLGIGKKATIYKKGETLMNYYANVIAKTQLSFPTSGLKNLLVGSYQTVWAHGPGNFLKGVVESFNSDYRAVIRKGGHTEVGLRHIETLMDKAGVSSKLLDKVFWFGAMRPTENINRYIAVRAGKADQHLLVDRITNKRFEGTKKYNQAMYKLKEFYKLTDKDINLLKENGMGGLSGNNKIKGLKRVAKERELAQLYQKMDTAAHIYTQGATLNLFMPDWADKGAYKPLTLYKRMAYAATVNTINNTRIAYKSGNMMNILAGTFGAYLSGETLIALYDTFLGQAPPHQNDDWWERFGTTMWKGEFMGIFSEWWKPDGGMGFGDSLSPAIYNHLFMMLTSIGSSPLPLLGDKTKTYAQTADDILKSTFSNYNQVQKIRKRRMNPYNKGHIEYQKLYKEFEKKLKPDESKESLAISRTIKSPYFDDLKTAFNTGKEEEFARQYVLTYYAIANDYNREGMDNFGMPVRNLNEAFKQAHKTMKLKMKGLNPNKGSYDKTSKIGKRRSTLFQERYLTPEQKKELQTLETQYNVKLRKFKSNFKKYLKEFNLPELGGRFDWK